MTYKYNLILTTFENGEFVQKKVGSTSSKNWGTVEKYLQKVASKVLGSFELVRDRSSSLGNAIGWYAADNDGNTVDFQLVP